MCTVVTTWLVRLLTCGLPCGKFVSMCLVIHAVRYKSISRRVRCSKLDIWKQHKAIKKFRLDISAPTLHPHHVYGWTHGNTPYQSISLFIHV